MKAVVLLSGGMDSATLLYDCLDRGHEVYALSMHYGQRHKREIEHARALCVRNNVSFREVELGALRELLGGSALTDDKIEVPEGHYEAESMKATVVPMRNAIFLSVACGYAWSLGAEMVFTAVHAGDHAIYPDCRPSFIDAFNTMADEASDGFIEPTADGIVVAPYVEISKLEIARLGDGLDVPWDLTWSCYKGGEVHCGKCGTCVERREALAPFDDPTVYAE